MIIYGVALLSVSLIFGMLIGEALGVMLGLMPTLAEWALPCCFWYSPAIQRHSKP